MAFCTNCGKSLDEGARFCTTCGTPVPVATVPAITAIPGPSAGVATAPAPAASTLAPDTKIEAEIAPSGNASPSAPAFDFSNAPQSSTPPTLIIVCVVLLVLIGVGIVGTVYLQRQGKAKAEQQSSAEPAIQTSSSVNPAPVPASSSAPTTSVATPTPAEPAPVTSAPAPVADSVRAMNLGNYPGAAPVAIATLTGETVVAGFLTRDTPQQVIQYYKVRFPISVSAETEGKAELSATLPGGQRIRIQATPQGTNTQVMVLQER